jgi:hypothetical protein
MSPSAAAATLGPTSVDGDPTVKPTGVINAVDSDPMGYILFVLLITTVTCIVWHKRKKLFVYFYPPSPNFTMIDEEIELAGLRRDLVEI